MNITCVPTGDHMFVDCDECGALGLIEPRFLHDHVTEHLRSHGVVTQDIHVCDCGFDWASTTGHPLDRVTCRDCTFEAYGMYADHDAHHHHLTTQHTWTLHPGRAA